MPNHPRVTPIPLALLLLAPICPRLHAREVVEGLPSDSSIPNGTVTRHAATADGRGETVTARGRAQSLRRTQVVMQRAFCTTVVFRGSRSSPPSACAARISSASSTR